MRVCLPSSIAIGTDAFAALTRVTDTSDRQTQTTPELSTGPFCVTRSNSTHQLADPTRPDPIQLTMELTV